MAWGLPRPAGLLLIPATGSYVYPDVMVICGEIELSGDRQDFVSNPQVVIEVLSKSTANYDRGEKFLHYRSLSTLRDNLLISQDSVRVEHYEKQDEGSWVLREYTSVGDVVWIRSIEASIGLAAVYEI